MGFFSSSGFFNPVGDAGNAVLGQDSESDRLFSVANDPLDLMGHRARNTSDRISDINQQAADRAIRSQEGQIDRVSGLFDPFVQAGGQPLSELVGAFTGQEDFNFTPSEQFTQGLERGVRGGRRAAAARGLLDSSGTEARLSDLVNAATGQEVQRQIESRLQPVQVAQDASRIIGQQEAASAGAGSSIFSNLANQNLANAANLGAARQSSFQSAAGGLQGLSSLLASQ